MKLTISILSFATSIVLCLSSSTIAQEPSSWSEAASQAGVYSPAIASNDLEVIGGGRRIGRAIFDRNWSRMVMVYTGFESANTNAGDIFDGQADVDLDVVGIDIGRRHSDFLRSSIDFTYRSGDISSEIDPTSTLPFVAATGEMDVYSLMKNFHLDFPATNRGFQPYIGVGLGIAYADSLGTLNGSPAFIEGDTGFAYQGMAGVSWKLRNLSSIYAEYRYFSTTEMDLVNAGGLLNQGNYSSHDVLFGLKFGF